MEFMIYDLSSYKLKVSKGQIKVSKSESSMSTAYKAKSRDFMTLSAATFRPSDFKRPTSSVKHQPTIIAY